MMSKVLRFSIRDLLFTTTIAALAVGWWLSMRNHDASVESLKGELQVEKGKRQADVSFLQDRCNMLKAQYSSLHYQFEAHLKAQQRLNRSSALPERSGSNGNDGVSSEEGE